MLEIRYNQLTKEVTGWCGDKSQFGALKVRADEDIVQIDIPLPPLTSSAYIFDEATQNLKPNPNHIVPPDLQAEFDKASTIEDKLAVMAKKLGLGI